MIFFFQYCGRQAWRVFQLTLSSFSSAIYRPPWGGILYISPSPLRSSQTPSSPFKPLKNPPLPFLKLARMESSNTQLFRQLAHMKKCLFEQVFFFCHLLFNSSSVTKEKPHLNVEVILSFFFMILFFQSFFQSWSLMVMVFTHQGVGSLA